MSDAAVDTEVVDEMSIPSDRRRTKTMPPLTRGVRIELDLDDPDGLAEFFEAIAKLARSKRRLLITVE